MLLVLAGVVVLGIVMADVIWTTVSSQGGGMITNPLIKGIDRLLHVNHRTQAKSRLLSISGPLTISIIMLVWLIGLWAGWLLIFSADPQWVVDAKTQSPVDLIGRTYYVGFTISTLGIGDFVPGSETARILTPIAAFNGLTIATLAITYVISVVSATVQKRQLAFSISGLGGNPVELLNNSWNGTDFRGLDLPLNTLATQLTLSAEQHLAYPILTSFHSQEPGGALALQVAVLDETLSLLTNGIVPSQQPSPAILTNVRSALSHYLSRVEEPGYKLEPVPQTPPLDTLRALARDLTPEGEYADAMHKLADRRQLLQMTLHKDGWQWSDVYGRAESN